MRRTTLLLLLWSGCAMARPNPPSLVAPASPAPGEVNEPPLVFLAVCREACSRASAHRAVGAQMIDAECTTSCVDGWALPAVRTGKDLSKLDGRRVRVFGHRAAGLKITLGDGTEVLLSGEHADDAIVGTHEVVVIATVDAGALVDITVIAPSGDAHGGAGK